MQLSNRSRCTQVTKKLCKIKDAAANDLLPSMIPTKIDVAVRS